MATTLEALLTYETDNNRPADGRRVISAERQALQAAQQALTELERARLRSSNLHTREQLQVERDQEIVEARARVKRLAEDAARTLSMWS